MRFTDEKLYVLGIGEAYMVEPGTGNILYWTNKMREADVSFSATDNVLSAGIGNGPAIIIPTDPNITVNVTAADYSEYVFGTNDTNNALRGYMRYAELGDRCGYVTVNSLGVGTYFDGLEAGDFVQGVSVPAAQVSTTGRYRLENYTNTGNSYVQSGGSATLIHKTGYGQETAVSTTDGGATWA